MEPGNLDERQHLTICNIYILALQKSVAEWQAKKEEMMDTGGIQEEAKEDNIYAVTEVCS